MQKTKKQSHGYYPSLIALQEKNPSSMTNLGSLFKNHALDPDLIQFKPDYIYRTDRIDVDKDLQQFEHLIENAKIPQQKQQMEALLSRTESVSDLSENLYRKFKQNKNTFSYWYPALKKAYETNKTAHAFFKIPATNYITLPIELSQFIRIEYQDTNERSRKLFNKILFDKFNLDENKEYFAKTGEFSSKFEFQNAHITDPKAIGEYFQVINNFAMQVGAGRTNDLVIREYIPDPENRPTIYNGMPLRTEFRTFVDLDTKTLIGTVPYWNPVVMNHTFRRQAEYNAKVQADRDTYYAFQDTLTTDYNKHVNNVNQHIKALIKDFPLTGQWSLDIMKSGNDFYLIDMATMQRSALSEYLPKYNNLSAKQLEMYLKK